MWAAYIDLDYAGGKIGEYQFYDRSTQRWDATSCGKNHGRCAKMDCHLPSTHFKLLGFFKEPNYHEWMEQLFKHRKYTSTTIWSCCHFLVSLTMICVSLCSFLFGPQREYVCKCC